MIFLPFRLIHFRSSDGCPSPNEKCLIEVILSIYFLRALALCHLGRKTLCVGIREFDLNSNFN